VPTSQFGIGPAPGSLVWTGIFAECPSDAERILILGRRALSRTGRDLEGGDRGLAWTMGDSLPCDQETGRPARESSIIRCTIA